MSLLARVKKAAKPDPKPGPMSWYDRLPAGERAEFDEVTRAFKAGEINVSAKSLAKALVEDYRARGVAVCSAVRLRKWLSLR